MKFQTPLLQLKMVFSLHLWKVISLRCRHPISISYGTKVYVHLRKHSLVSYFKWGRVLSVLLLPLVQDGSLLSYQCWSLLYSYKEPLVWVLKNELELAWFQFHMHKWSQVFGCGSNSLKKFWFQFQFWKSDLALIWFLLTETGTNGWLISS